MRANKEELARLTELGVKHGLLRYEAEQLAREYLADGKCWCGGDIVPNGLGHNRPSCSRTSVTGCVAGAGNWQTS